MSATLRVLAACCFLALCALPLAAGEVPPADSAEATVEMPAADATSSCPSLIAGLPDAFELAPCMVTVSCSDGSSVSCNGNSSCSTSGTNGRCVTCDGVQQACCALTACEQCEVDYYNCISTCEFPVACNMCEMRYGWCTDVHQCP